MDTGVKTSNAARIVLKVPCRPALSRQKVYLSRLLFFIAVLSTIPTWAQSELVFSRTALMFPLAVDSGLAFGENLLVEFEAAGGWSPKPTLQQVLADDKITDGSLLKVAATTFQGLQKGDSDFVRSVSKFEDGSQGPSWENLEKIFEYWRSVWGEAQNISFDSILRVNDLLIVRLDTSENATQNKKPYCCLTFRYTENDEIAYVPFHLDKVTNIFAAYFGDLPLPYEELVVANTDAYKRIPLPVLGALDDSKYGVSLLFQESPYQLGGETDSNVEQLMLFVKNVASEWQQFSSEELSEAGIDSMLANFSEQSAQRLRRNFDKMTTDAARIQLFRQIRVPEARQIRCVIQLRSAYLLLVHSPKSHRQYGFVQVVSDAGQLKYSGVLMDWAFDQIVQDDHVQEQLAAITASGSS